MTPYEHSGVECGEGWKKLYQPLIDLCGLLGVEVMQVKEKWGYLHFYVGERGAHGEALDMAIRYAEAKSFHVCEDCGLEDKTKLNMRQVFTGTTVWECAVTTEAGQYRGWIRTLCAPCREKWDTRRDTQS